MKTVITGKNYTPSEKLKDIIEKKFAKLDKYFSDETTANVATIKEKGGYKVEATINTKGKHNMFNFDFNMGNTFKGMFGKIDKGLCALSMSGGIAIRTSNGSYKT